MSMSAKDAIEFLLFAKRKEEESLLFQRWVAGPQFSMSFEEFKHKLGPVMIRDDADIEKEIRDLMRETESDYGNF